MAKLKIAKELFDLFFPVGYIYTSMNSTDPKTLFGYGTWTQIKDEFLYCTTSSNTTGGANNVSYTPKGSVSGHKLTVDEMPSHGHKIKACYGSPADKDMSSWSQKMLAATGGAGWCSNLIDNQSDNGNMGHTIIYTGGDKEHNHTFSGTSTTINTMPKYRTCYAWYRTA